jgi:hypothetical protein
MGEPVADYYLYKNIKGDGGSMGDIGENYTWGAPLGKASSSEKLQENLAQTLAAMAQDYWLGTAGLRSGVTNQLQKFISGNFDVTGTPVYAAGKGQAEDQYGIARQNLLSSMSSGGALNQSMGDLEGSRARTLADLASQIATDMYSKAYGEALGSPQSSFQGMIGAGQTESPVLQSQAAKVQAIASFCCFIFIAGHGYLHPIVRRYRDEHLTVANRRGYYWLSDRLVPIMQKRSWVRRLVKIAMIDPMTSYGKHFYGLNHIGALFSPIASMWLRVFSLLGQRSPYRRRGTGEVV